MQIWGGNGQAHNFKTERYYTEKGAGADSAEAFSEAGPENAERIKAGRWREDAFCVEPEHNFGSEIPGDNRGGSGTPTDKNNRGEGYGRDKGRGQFCEPIHNFGAEIIDAGPAQKQGKTSQRDGRTNVDAQIQRGNSHGQFCVEHDFESESYQRRSSEAGKSDKQTSNAGANGRDEPIQHATCAGCGAWRGALGLEPTVELFIEHMVEVFREVKRVLRDDGVLWVNMGDSYSTHASASPNHAHKFQSVKVANAEGIGVMPKPRVMAEKNLLMIPARLAIALQADGWICRSTIIWAKKAPMPESVTDRPTKSHEMIYMLTKKPRYFYDAEAVRQELITPLHAPGNLKLDASRNDHDRMASTWGTASGSNLRDTWILGPEPSKAAHYATFVQEIPRRAILASTSEYGACAECGAPWKRVKKASPEYARFLGKGYHDHSNDADQGMSQDKVLPRVSADYRTVGWEPTCAHKDAGVVPCTVLDPFSGSGTVQVVARQLGRRSIYIDLAEKYAKIAKSRLLRQTPAFDLVVERESMKPEQLAMAL